MNVKFSFPSDCTNYLHMKKSKPSENDFSDGFSMGNTA